jgi:glycosyltransferase involved in cell wall biosynthesis
MRIAYIAVKGMPTGGGIEKLTEEIGSRLVTKGHQIIVYSSRDYNAINGEFRGMEIRTVPSINTRMLHKLSICFNAVYHVISKDNVDLIHVHAVGPSVVAIFPRLKKIPTVVQTHGLEWKRDKWGFFAKAFFKLADATAVFFPHKTTSVSLVQKSYYENRFGKKVVYIPTGVNAAQRRKPQWILKQGLKPGHYIFFAARLVAEKGAHYLVDAFRYVETDMKLVIAGDAGHEKKYKALLKRKAEGDQRIIFPGYLTGRALEELFSNAYLFCLPSTIEGLPIALLEAMSYGNCCLTSDIPENIEAIKEHGYTFKNRDIEDLKRVLTELIEHPEKIKAMRSSARDYVLRNYSWDAITDQMEALYLSLFSSTS